MKSFYRAISCHRPLAEEDLGSQDSELLSIHNTSQPTIGLTKSGPSWERFANSSQSWPWISQPWVDHDGRHDSRGLKDGARGANREYFHTENKGRDGKISIGRQWYTNGQF